MKTISTILTLSALLASAGLVQAAPQAPDPAGANAEALPNAHLTNEVMYKVLAAELAFQRGDAFSAYATMLSVARGTGDPRLARRAVEFAAAGSLMSEALKAARLWNELAPRSEEAAQALVGLQIAAGRLDEAKQALARQLASAAPAALPAAIANVQRQLARVQDKQRGIAMMRELLEPYRNSVDAQLTLAQIAMVGGDRTTALREARAALDKHPTSELAALTLAQIVGDKDEAAKVLVDFLKKNPRAREVRLAYSRMLFEQNRLADAKREFQTLLQQYPQDQTALYAIGLLSAQANELDDADRYLASYIKSLNGQPDRERDATQALMVLAQIAEQRGDIPAALKWLEMVDGSGQGNYLGATMKRAQLTAQSGNLDAARALLQRADVDSEDERIKLIVSEAQLLRDAGRLREAMQLIEDALENHADSVDLLYEHAMLAEKDGQFDLMERQLRKMMTLAPDNQHAYNALGYSLADRNQRLPEAYDLIKKALSLAPEDPYIMDSLGWVEFRMGRYEQAEATLRRAYGLKPDPEIAAHLGEVLWVLGREEEARTLWRNANAKDPRNATLQGTLQRLQVKL